MGLPHGASDDLERELARQRRAEALTVAGLHLRRGDHAAALTQCQTLLASDADDLDARELLGDLLAAQGRWDAAIAEFQRVVGADPHRARAERKLAEASLARAGLKDVAFAAEEDEAPRKPGTASVLSLLFPGLGQLYNHHLSKGLAALAAGLTLALFILWGVLLAPMQVVNASLAGRQVPSQQVLARWADALLGMGVGLRLLLLVACVLWLCLHLWSIFDAARGAQRHVSTSKAAGN